MQTQENSRENPHEIKEIAKIGSQLSLMEATSAPLGVLRRYVGPSWRHLAATWRQDAPKEPNLSAKPRQKKHQDAPETTFLTPRRARRNHLSAKRCPKRENLRKIEPLAFESAALGNYLGSSWRAFALGFAILAPSCGNLAPRRRQRMES